MYLGQLTGGLYSHIKIQNWKFTVARCLYTRFLILEGRKTDSSKVEEFQGGFPFVWKKEWFAGYLVNIVLY